MATIFELKEQGVTQTPLYLFTVQLPNGAEHRWCTHRVEHEGCVYEPRVLGHNLFEMRADADEGIDSVMKLTVTLANADSYCSQIERTTGWKGSKVSVQFAFFDLKQGAATSESMVVFRGTAQSPEQITETALRLSVSNRMNLQRLLIPEVRIQRRCPWKFPASAEQRAEAAEGGTRGKYSPFYRCGYSPDVEGGRGNLSGEAPYVSCNYTRVQCEQRGMFDRDTANRETRRFGGIEFVPPTILVRSAGERGSHLSPVLENEGRYNDFVPVVYGTAWYAPPVVFARNDGNLTRMEVLLGLGEIQGALKVLVNDIEIPPGRAGADMTATGWHNLVSPGTRTGAFNRDFSDSAGNPMGDPYGSMAFLSVVAPNRINDGKSLPRVQVLLEGLKVARYGADGACLGDYFDNNPAWVILDILRRSGWEQEDIDLESFANAAAFCGEPIEVRDLYGNPVQVPRFQTNLVLRRRRSVADIIRGIRAASCLYLGQGTDGKLQLKAEGSLAAQQPVKPAWSNSREELNGGWPSYEFGDGTNGAGGILRKENGEPAIRFWSRSPADTPNRFSIEFQDEFNEYQQDSLSLVDIEDTLRTGQEISAALNVAGIPNFHQAARAIRLQLNKSVRGNCYVEFETSMRGLGLRPGDIITLTYLKEGFLRQPFRIRSIAPGLNYHKAQITAQIHDDGWYTEDEPEGNPGTRREPGIGGGPPRPLLGDRIDEDGDLQFSVEERWDPAGGDGSNLRLRAGFVPGRPPEAGSPGIPLVSLSTVIQDSDGALRGDQTLYYAVTGVGGDGTESTMSFLARASIPAGSDANCVQLRALSFAPGTASFRVYRGEHPDALLRIATEQAISNSFTDPGLERYLEAPPDPNYDHANFYWRYELQPETAATIWSRNSIGSESLEMRADEYRGKIVRITKGAGKGQERVIRSNTATEINLSGEWSLAPDATSAFVVAEANWRFGATGNSSPMEFEVPIRTGTTIHISGRSANVNDKECAYELSPLTRWRIGSGGAPVDTSPPGRPVFGLHATGQGTVELRGIGFEDPTNTRTATAGTLILHYWPELEGSPIQHLSEAADGESTVLGVDPPVTVQSGDLIQAGGEILEVAEVLSGGASLRVVRGAHGSTVEAHAAGTPLFALRKKGNVLSFPRDFFGSPASGAYSHSIHLPNARIAVAELVVKNAVGNSEPGRVLLTAMPEYGLRTLAGGQILIQAQGYLAIQADIAPPVVIEETRSVRDVYAVVREAPEGEAVELRLRRNEAEYCRLAIPAGATRSNTIPGSALPLLIAGSRLSLDVLSAPQGGTGAPGRDLTVAIRL